MGKWSKVSEDMVSQKIAMVPSRQHGDKHNRIKRKFKPQKIQR